MASLRDPCFARAPSGGSWHPRYACVRTGGGPLYFFNSLSRVVHGLPSTCGVHLLRSRLGLRGSAGRTGPGREPSQRSVRDGEPSSPDRAPSEGERHAHQARRPTLRRVLFRGDRGVGVGSLLSVGRCRCRPTLLHSIAHGQCLVPRDGAGGRHRGPTRPGRIYHHAPYGRFRGSWGRVLGPGL